MDDCWSGANTALIVLSINLGFAKRFIMGPKRALRKDFLKFRIVGSRSKAHITLRDFCADIWQLMHRELANFYTQTLV